MNKEKKNKNKEKSMEMLRKFQFLVVVLGWRSGSAVCADPRREDLPPNRHFKSRSVLCEAVLRARLCAKPSVSGPFLGGSLTCLTTDDLQFLRWPMAMDGWRRSSTLHASAKIHTDR